jgi:hypothetical protein
MGLNCSMGKCAAASPRNSKHVLPITTTFHLMVADQIIALKVLPQVKKMLCFSEFWSSNTDEAQCKIYSNHLNGESQYNLLSKCYSDQRLSVIIL